MTATPPQHIAGLTEPTVQPLERVAIRLRERTVTLSAWRMGVAAPEGAGALVRLETPEGALFRGEGWFLGWTQQAMSGAWAELVPTPPSEAMDLQQLG